MVEKLEGRRMGWSKLGCGRIGDSSSCLCFANLT